MPPSSAEIEYPPCGHTSCDCDKGKANPKERLVFLRVLAEPHMTDEQIKLAILKGFYQGKARGGIPSSLVGITSIPFVG